MGTGEKGKHRTADMYYAAYLKVCAVPFLGDEKEDGRVWFLFEDQGSKVMRDLKRQFFSGTAKVSALDLVQAIKTMKQLTHLDD